MYKEDLTNLQWLICDKNPTQPNQNKTNQLFVLFNILQQTFKSNQLIGQMSRVSA